MSESISNIGYHITKIPHGKFGDVSKIEEEFCEFKDAVEQNVKLMQLQELSDLLGAIDGWLQLNHPTISLNDLLKMAEVTKRAFLNGHR